MDKSEKKLLIAMVAVLAITIGSCAYLVTAVDDQFGQCKGLEGAVNKVWTGEPCNGESQND